MSNLPKGWETKDLKDLSNKPQYGITASATNNSTGVRFLRITDIDEYGLLGRSEPAFISISEKEKEKYKINVGDLIIARTGATAGKSYVHKNGAIEMVFASYLIRFPIISDIIHPKYAEYFTRSDFYWKQIRRFSTDTARANVNANVLQKLKIPMPPKLEDQQKIVDILDHAHNIIQHRKKAIELTEELIEAAFYEMFGDPISNPNGWGTKAILNFGNILTGTTPSKKYTDSFGGNIPFITPGDLENDMKNVKRTLTENGAKRSRMTRAGSTMICCIGTIGKTDSALIDSCFNQQINAIEWNHTIYDVFGKYLLKYSKQLLISRASKAVVPILNKTEFSKIKVLNPPETTIKKFNEIAMSNEKMKSSLEIALKLEQQQFQALLQAAFEGKLTENVGGENGKE